MKTIGTHVDGGLSERIAVPARLLHSAQGLDPDVAALIEPLSIGLHAVHRSHLAEGDRVVVFGAGPIGLAVLLAARESGARVFVADLEASRLNVALALGADCVVNSRQESAAERILEWTSGEGPVAAFEATGVPAVLSQAIEVVGPSGTVVVVGLSNETVPIPMVVLTRKELNILGSRNSNGEFGDAARMVARNRQLIGGLISHRIPFERGAEAFELALNNPASTEKVTILMPAS